MYVEKVADTQFELCYNRRAASIKGVGIGMRKVAIVGVGMIPFERRDEDSLVDMLSYAALNAMDDAGIGDRPIDAVYVGNMSAGLFNHQTSVASALVDRINLLPAAADSVENGPASGGSAVKNGVLAVASGYYDLVLVVGDEAYDLRFFVHYKFVS